MRPSVKIILVLILSFVTQSSFSQNSIVWQKCFGGILGDDANSLDATYDGGYIINGMSRSNDSIVSGNHGSNDFFVVKTDRMGNLQWQKFFGGTLSDVGYSVKQTQDSGYVLAGITFSNDGDVTGNHGGSDIWVVKIDSLSNIEWQHCFGGRKDEWLNAMELTSDGGYILAGRSDSVSDDVTSNYGSVDAWILKLNSNGIIEWQHSYGGSLEDQFRSIEPTNNGGYIAAGLTWSSDSDVTFNNGMQDAWIMKIDNAGNMQWQKSFGGSHVDIAHSILQTFEDEYIIAGATYSNDGDVSGNHAAFPYNDVWIVKLDSNGTLVWQKCYGGSDSEIATKIIQTSDSNYVAIGITESDDGDVTNKHPGPHDIWIMNITKNGTLNWQKCYGGTEVDIAFSILQDSDGGYIFSGRVESNDADVAGNNGSDDAWLVKVDATIGVHTIEEFLNLKVIPVPASDHINIAFNLKSLMNVNVEIRNILGVSIYCKTFRLSLSVPQYNLQIPVSEITNGIYFLTISSKNYFSSEKIIVSH